MTVLAVDVGGTTIRGAALDSHGIMSTAAVPTPGEPGRGDPGGRALCEVVSTLAASCAGQVDAVGIGVCEYVHRGEVTSAEVLAWGAQPARLLGGLVPVGCAVSVESDVRCGAWAELVLGALRHAPLGVFVSWGTGLSSAVTVGHSVLEGVRGRALALGELRTSGGDRLEGMASGRGMHTAYLRQTGDAVTGPELMARARSGDPAAGAVTRLAGQELALALLGVVRLLDPAVIVVGGGLGSADTPARESLWEAWEGYAVDVPLMASPLGPDGPLLGAGIAAGWSPEA